VQFRKWANQIVKDYTIQGWTMDVERLKRGGNLTDEFFERQLEKIREIRLSERKFYQKITDIYATALDYDPTATATKRFFAAVQNKMHYAIHGQTAAEVIVDRADHRKENMGLTHWEGAPHGKIYRYDVAIAKNYLSEFELAQMLCLRISSNASAWPNEQGAVLIAFTRGCCAMAGPPRITACRMIIQLQSGCPAPKRISSFSK
jgi:hypothetical protein